MSSEQRPTQATLVLQKKPSLLSAQATGLILPSLLPQEEPIIKVKRVGAPVLTIHDKSKPGHQQETASSAQAGSET